MNRFLMIAAVAATALGGGQMALADSRPTPPECRQNDRKCPEPRPAETKRKDGDRREQPRDAHRNGNHRPDQPRDARRAEHRAPRPGDNGRDARPFVRAENSRFAPAPRGQEYRVIRDQLVLVDQKTKRIVSVLGPVEGRR